jgi:hypothetical protein
MITLRGKWNKKYTSRLGMIVILSGQIEYLHKLYIKQFLGDFNKGMIVTWLTPYNSLIEITTALVKYEIKDKHLRKRYFDLLVRIVDAKNGRNGFVHGAWGRDDDGTAIRLSHSRSRTQRDKEDDQGIKKNEVPIKLGEMDELIKELKAIKKELRALRLDIWPELRKKAKALKLGPIDEAVRIPRPVFAAVSAST